MNLKIVTLWIKELNLQTLSLCLVAMALPWPIRFSTLSIVLFVTVSLPTLKWPVKFNAFHSAIIYSGILYFLFHLAYWIFQSGAGRVEWMEVEKKLSLLFLPALILNKDFILNKLNYKLIFLGFSFSVILACIVCIVVALINYFFTGDDTWFYYHAFCKPIRHHAVYFSLQICLALLSIYYLIKDFRIKIIHVLAFLLFAVCILLLSSKLMIPCFIATTLFVISRQRKMSKFYIVLTSVVIVSGMILATLFTGNIRQRYSELSAEKIRSIESGHFTPDSRFDGLSLRLLQIKFAYEIIDDNDAWLLGTGPDRSQKLLNDKYRQAGMYMGTDDKSGFTGLNFHNQFIETLVRFGIAGLLVLLFILFIFIRESIAARNSFLLWTLLLFLTFFFTESVLETQRGIVLFLFFTLLLLKADIFNDPFRINDQENI